MEQSFEASKPASSDIFPPAKLYLLSLLKQCHQMGTKHLTTQKYGGHHKPPHLTMDVCVGNMGELKSHVFCIETDFTFCFQFVSFKKPQQHRFLFWHTMKIFYIWKVSSIYNYQSHLLSFIAVILWYKLLTTFSNKIFEHLISFIILVSEHYNISF